MYEELIRQLEPKPKFNLNWYDQSGDTYSEGKVEDLLISIIAENKPEDYVEAVAKNYNWSTYYHLTPIRKNILNWYPFAENSHVLEIGCGLGAITGSLCDRCGKVTAVELSLRRATAALLRCREKENLEIIVGNLNDIEFDEKFDYITLIGVLEYQGSYTNTENPYMDFLVKVKSLLKPDGKLLIAIENQYGLKYWCGAREDHTSVPFEGMNQYKFSGEKVRTFSKDALDKLIKASGFKNTYFYYPMPDYKLPTVVYSEQYLPKDGNMMNLSYYYIPDTHTMVAQEANIYNDIIKNDVFEFFANSFLVECSDDREIGEVKFASLSCNRTPEYCVGTKIVDRTEVVKFPLYPVLGEQHIAQTLQNEQGMIEHNLSVVKSHKEGVELHTKFVEYQTLEDVLLEAYRHGDREQIYKWFDQLMDQILKSSPQTSWTHNLLYTFGLDIEQDEEKYGVILQKGCLDMIPRNAFVDETKTIYWFDQEWNLENIPAKYIMYRALKEFYYSYGELCSKIIPLSVLAQRYDLLLVWEDMKLMEELFMGAVIDQTLMAEMNGFGGDCGNDVVNNINKLLK